MPSPKTKPRNPRGKVEGKTFIWETEDGDTVTIPLRIKLKLIRSMSSIELDADGMFAFLEALIPDQTATLDEMDVNDFSTCFKEWQTVYNGLQGADLGESSSSST
ncbi:MAG: hypothetical protein M3P04_13875 [Actinomycetota bacterium]|nr:hypothetical protein [Actinomycetota bacterium]